jgi:tetratricopeptide (TPR) repeat protein
MVNISITMMLLLVSAVCHTASAQEPNDHISKGNSLYKGGKYGDAEVSYREGQAAGADAFISGFNLGDALFKQERYEEAAAAFQSLPQLTEDNDKKASAYHNLGNSFLKAKKYQESVDAFKQSLRNNPSDLDTKYNLAYAKRMLQQQQQQEQQKQDQKQDEKKDEKQEQDQKGDNKDDKQDKQDKQDKGDKPKDEKGEKDQQEQPKDGEISKEDAERMLDALNQDEKKIRDRLEAQKVKTGTKGKVEKDW